jgi:hypothetical protein
VSALKDFLGRLATSIKAGGQQRESLFQQRRKRFLSIHDSVTSPPQLLVLPPRRLRWTSVFVWIYLLLFLFVGVRFFERTVVAAFRQVEAREVETRQWVEKRTAESPHNDREVNRHRLLMEVSELEAETARKSRWTLFYLSIPMALATIVLPMALLWFFLRIRHLLLNGTVTRAEFLSRRLWPSSAGRLRLVTNDGTQVEVIRTVPLSVPVGTTLWVLYSPRNPKHILVYSREIAKLLSK